MPDTHNRPHIGLNCAEKDYGGNLTRENKDFLSEQTFLRWALVNPYTLVNLHANQFPTRRTLPQPSL